jgi:hypothetical protein
VRSGATHSKAQLDQSRCVSLKRRFGLSGSSVGLASLDRRFAVSGLWSVILNVDLPGVRRVQFTLPGRTVP